MRWLADECLDARIAVWLREQGHDVLSMLDARGTADRDVAARATKEGRVLLTEDKDFGELVTRHGLPVPGLVSLRVMSEDLSVKIAQPKTAIERYGDALMGAHTVIDGKRIRHRSLSGRTVT